MRLRFQLIDTSGWSLSVHLSNLLRTKLVQSQSHFAIIECVSPYRFNQQGQGISVTISTTQPPPGWVCAGLHGKDNALSQPSICMSVAVRQSADWLTNQPHETITIVFLDCSYVTIYLWLWPAASSSQTDYCVHAHRHNFIKCREEKEKKKIEPTNYNNDIYARCERHERVAGHCSRRYRIDKVYAAPAALNEWMTSERQMRAYARSTEHTIPFRI